MSLEQDVSEQTIDDIAARLGSPDFGDFADDEKSPEITDQVMAEKGETPKINAGDLLSTMVVFGTNYLAARRGEHWVLSEDEARGLSHAIDEAMPDVEMSPMWALGAVSVGIFGPRIMTDINLSKVEEENEDEETTDTPKAT
ncbi:hypothetical protein NDQ71_02815 [Pseudoalteromonas sp. KG3]|uniref:hypothetical protein n=1 Tax=Pseudoalteromonas sp. KG3 TaxID=2951137 RepID=UPI00265989F9|nr:hypothetical protein [Pseudoalteromonas sp. KG3]WKD24042.1 hypothetical protein NDQ71_02815 [Pseudoalteromonas sp. KG3]